MPSVQGRPAAAETSDDQPYWHEAEFGCKVSRRLKKADLGPPVFPTEDGGGGAVRWPSIEEAQLHGYQTVEDGSGLQVWGMCEDSGAAENFQE